MLQRMMRMMMPTSCLIVFLLAASFSFAQTEFSAEMVDTQKPDHPSNGKMYFSKDKVRFESAKKDPRMTSTTLPTPPVPAASAIQWPVGPSRNSWYQ